MNNSSTRATTVATSDDNNSSILDTSPSSVQRSSESSSSEDTQGRSENNNNNNNNDNNVGSETPSRARDAFLYFSNQERRMAYLMGEEINNRGQEHDPQEEGETAEQRKTRISFELHPSLLIEDDLLIEMEDDGLDDDLLDDLLVQMAGWESPMWESEIIAWEPGVGCKYKYECCIYPKYAR